MKSLFDLEQANLAVVKSISSLKLGTRQLNLHNLSLLISDNDKLIM